MQGEIKETEKDEEDEDTVEEIDEEDDEDEGEGNYSNGDDEDMIQNDIGPGGDDFREIDGGSSGEETQEGNQVIRGGSWHLYFRNFQFSTLVFVKLSVFNADHEIKEIGSQF